VTLYITELFDLELDFPPGWSFRAWGDKTKKSTMAHQFFKSDQDFPVEYDDTKILFTAILRLDGSSWVMDASLNLSLIKRQDDYSLKNEPNANREGIKT
jgi:hypothetical protein